MHTPRTPIGFRQLCAIARALLTTDPTMDDSEWREQIKCRIIALGYTYPTSPQTIPDAMTRVERAMERESGPRPAQHQSPRPLAPARRVPELRSTGPRIDRPWTSLADVIAGIQQRRRKRHDAA